MTKRPTSITVIGWVLIVTGILSFPDVVARALNPSRQEMMARSPVPIPAQLAMSLAGGAVNAVSGYFLLRGRSWARYLFVVWSVSQFSYALTAWGLRLAIIPGVFIFLLVTYLLFRPQASAFFAGTGSRVFVDARPSVRQILSLGSYVLAGSQLTITCLIAFASAPSDEVIHGEFPGAMAKSAVLAMFSVQALVLLLIGWGLSTHRHLTRDFGIVLAVSTVVGALMVVMLNLMYLDPEFRKMVPEDSGWIHGYTTGIVWLAVLGGLSWLALRKSRATSDEKAEP